MGTMMIAVAAFTPYATTSALYYLVHSTFSAAALFLLADLVVTRRAAGDTLTAQPPTVQNGLFAALFFAGAIAMAGMPPLSGFLGKLVILDAIRDSSFMALGWVAILLGSLLIIVGFARAGSILFWKSTVQAPEDATVSEIDDPEEGEAPVEARPKPATALELAPTVVSLAVLAFLSAAAGPVTNFLEDASAQLYDNSGYISAVLPEGENSSEPGTEEEAQQ